ncbi:MAG: TlpA disulfide reductase family protein [Candidatus Sericytochromatia bacterium]
MSQTRSNSQKMTYLILGLAFLGLGAVFALTISQQLQGSSSKPEQVSASAQPPADGNLEGQKAPDFALKNLQGQSVKLSDYQGKIVFLNFWATWCEPCKEEMPSMQRLRAKMANRPFEILAVSLDPNPTSEVPAFESSNKLTLNFPVLQDPEQNTAKNLYRTTGVPESFIIGADGKVIKHVIGAYEWDNAQIMAYFEDLLKAAEKQAAPQS